MNAIKLSYIIPVYNGIDTVGKCLDSIFSLPLNHEEYEVIVIDDCSTDGTITVLNQYLEQHANMTVVRQTKNHRQGAARNIGIRLAKGEYIAFADADDEIVPENVSRIIHSYYEKGYDMIGGHYYEQCNNSKYEKGLDLLQDIELTGVDFCENYYDPVISACPCSYFYRNDFLKNQNHPFEEDVVWEDVDWVQWHLFFCSQILVCRSSIYVYYQHDNSTIHTISVSHYSGLIKMGCRKIVNSGIFAVRSPKYSAIIMDNAIWNIEQTISRLWKINDINEFYRQIGSPSLELLKNYHWSRWTRLFVNHRILFSILHKLLFPFRLLRKLKRK